jgi:hypothetical protein
MWQHHGTDRADGRIETVNRSGGAAASRGIDQNYGTRTLHQFENLDSGPVGFEHLGPVVQPFSNSASRDEPNRVVPSEWIADSDDAKRAHSKG